MRILFFLAAASFSVSLSLSRALFVISTHRRWRRRRRGLGRERKGRKKKHRHWTFEQSKWTSSELNSIEPKDTFPTKKFNSAFLSLSLFLFWQLKTLTRHCTWSSNAPSQLLTKNETTSSHSVFLVWYQSLFYMKKKNSPVYALSLISRELCYMCWVSRRKSRRDAIRCDAGLTATLSPVDCKRKRQYQSFFSAYIWLSGKFYQ